MRGKLPPIMISILVRDCAKNDSSKSRTEHLLVVESLEVNSRIKMNDLAFDFNNDTIFPYFASQFIETFPRTQYIL